MVQIKIPDSVAVIKRLQKTEHKKNPLLTGNIFLVLMAGAACKLLRMTTKPFSIVTVK